MSESKKQLWLEQALQQQIISVTQRAQLSALPWPTENGHTPGAPVPDYEEKLKPISTLNELFVTFGIFILIGAINSGASLLLPPLAEHGFHFALPLLAAYLLHRQKRFRLPIIYCSLHAAFMAAALARFLHTGNTDFLSMADASMVTVIAPLIAATLTLGGASAWFRLPFLMLPIGVLFAVVVTLAAKEADHDASHRLVLGGAGFAILAFAITMDLQDKTRSGKKSDYAFWSYVSGSPLFVHALMLPLIFNPKTLETPWALVALLVFTITALGLLLNRRALILSTLIYVTILIAKLLASLGEKNTGDALIVISIFIGIYVVVLGMKWATIRRHLLTRLAPHAPWVRHLPVY